MKTNSFSKYKVFVGLSGGVDSSVSAYLLKKMGFSVTGIFMKNWSGDEFGLQENCPWEEDQKDAENVCRHLGIEFMSFNFEKEYKKSVIDYFFSEYSKGRTPNPDIMCNKEIKFKLFLEKSLQLGADFIATGHYAVNHTLRKIADSYNVDYKNGLFCSADQNKDQTYFLYSLTLNQITHTLFPIGGMTKKEIRKLAEEIKLPNAQKKDSQGICFVGDIDVRKFLALKLGYTEGDIVDIDTNKKIGVHKGIYLYTIGQRSGIGIGGSGEPYYVAEKDTENNILYVAKGSNNPKLFKTKIILENLHVINGENLKKIMELRKNESSANLVGCIRYRQNKIKIKILDIIIESGKSIEGSFVIENPHSAEIEFLEPVKGVSPGQSLVIYLDNECIGGGVISKAE